MKLYMLSYICKVIYNTLVAVHVLLREYVHMCTIHWDHPHSHFHPHSHSHPLPLTLGFTSTICCLKYLYTYPYLFHFVEHQLSMFVPLPAYQTGKTTEAREDVAGDSKRIRARGSNT